MQGALYFPFIGVPDTAWWTRTLLYWDDIATIVPDAYIREPEFHEPYTLELVRAGLLHQVLPGDAGPGLRTNFERFLGALSGRELDRRRRAFTLGNVTRVHRDKWLTYMGGLEEVARLGLADLGYRSHTSDDWTMVEASTAAEFMAALALSLCQSANRGEWRRSDRYRSETWVPTTDMQAAIGALLSGLEPAGAEIDTADILNLRVRGEIRAARVRTCLLERLLPVPVSPMPAADIVDFKRKYGFLLPQLRRLIESRVDEILAMSDPITQVRLMDRMDEELSERCREAEAHLREAGIRRMSRSPLLRVLKFVPLLKDPAGSVQDLAQDLQTAPGFETQPLAYLAFARTIFEPIRDYRVDPLTGIPLVETMG